MLAVGHGLGGGRLGGTTGDAVDKLGIDAVGAEEIAEDADVRRRRGLDDGRPGSVAEKDARGTVLPVDDVGKFFGADDERAAVTSRAQHVGADLQGEDEARARGRDVEGWDVAAEA